MRIPLLIILFFSSLTGKGQSSYVIDHKGNIFSIDIASGCKSNLVYQCPHNFITDVASDYSGNIYVCSYDSLFVLNTNIPGSSCIYLGKFPNPVNGLMVWPDGNIYASGDGLSKYDPLTQTFNYLGKFPNNVFSAGDLIEYNNKMYLSTTDGDIYEININAPDLSTLYFKVGVTGIFGMIVISAKCSNQVALQQRVIAFEHIDQTSRAYLLDMENKIVFPDYCNPQVSIVGGTSIMAVLVLGDPILIKNIGSTTPYCNQIGDGVISLSMFPSLLNKYVFSIDNMPDTKKSVFKNLGAGLHHIRIKNQFGCYLDTSVIIPPANFECLDSVFVPSAFTPNEDGLNDIFRAKSFLPVTNIEMKIFNRYGQNIYTTFSLNDGWNGKFRFIPQPSGVFVWWLRYTNFSGKNIFRKGLVTLIR